MVGAIAFPPRYFDIFPDQSVMLAFCALRYAVTCPSLESFETAVIARWIPSDMFTSIVWWVSSR